MNPAILFYMKLEERECACGCKKTFRCLSTSKTRYSSLHCMDVAGVLPPTDKFGRAAKAEKPAGATVKDESDDSEVEMDSEDSEAPLLMEEDDMLDGEDADSKNPPELDPTA